MFITSTFCTVGDGPWDDVCKVTDTGSSAYIRDPIPRVNGLGMLDEQELQLLARKHIAANRLDQDALAMYSSKADALPAELSECEAKVKRTTASLNRGREVVETLGQAISLRAGSERLHSQLPPNANE